MFCPTLGQIVLNCMDELYVSKRTRFKKKTVIRHGLQKTKWSDLSGWGISIEINSYCAPNNLKIKGTLQDE